MCANSHTHTILRWKGGAMAHHLNERPSRSHIVSKWRKRRKRQTEEVKEVKQPIVEIIRGGAICEASFIFVYVTCDDFWLLIFCGSGIFTFIFLMGSFMVVRDIFWVIAMSQRFKSKKFEPKNFFILLRTLSFDSASRLENEMRQHSRRFSQLNLIHSWKFNLQT